MDSPKYLVVITLVEGQNFTLPDCVIDRTAQATVFAEARFDNEPLRSDPVKLVNTNPEFVTELAWQLDRRSLHQFRIERRAIKLQVFLQTTPIKKASPTHSKDKIIDDSSLSSSIGSSSQLETNQIQLVGYTVIHVRTIQERSQPKFEWRPLLNPKFRKPSYNRPEIQLAVTLIKCEDNPLETISNGPRNAPYVSRFQKTDLNSSLMENLDDRPDQFEYPDECGPNDDDDIIDSSNQSVDSQIYKTCLDYTLAHNYDNNKQDDDSRVAIIENDINIKVIDGHHYIYDALKDGSTIEECTDYFCLEVTIAFISDLEAILLGHTRHYLDSTSNSAKYYFTFSLFGSALKSEDFTIKECNLKPKYAKFTLATTSVELLNTYFTLNSALDIKFCNEHKKILGFATVQLDQLCCDLEADLRNGRSIEGMFSLQSCADNPVDYLDGASPTVGVAVVMKEIDSLGPSQELTQRPVLKSPTAKYFDQISSPSKAVIETVRNSTINEERIPIISDRKEDSIKLQDFERKSIETQSLPSPRVDVAQTSEFSNDLFSQDQMRHFCFTIDLKTLTTLDHIIMDLSNLLIRYSYSFFGYTDTITTESIIPIGHHEATIPHGFCEFNFATTLRSLQYAFDKVPLILELVLNRRSEHLNGQQGDTYDDEDVESVGYGQIRLATLFDIDKLRFNDDYCTMTSITVLGCDKSKLGNLQLYLSLKDLGPTRIDQNIIKDDAGNKAGSSLPANINDRVNFVTDIDKLLVDASNEIESWKDHQLLSFKNELQQKEQEYLNNITHKLEAKETKRDAELKKKMTDLNKLERKLRNALVIVESKEKHLDQKEQQLNTKDKELSNRLATIDLEVAKAIEEVIASYQRKDSDSQPNKPINAESQNRSNKISYGLSQPIRATRRSSLRDYTATSSRSPGIPIPVRSTSLVRGSIEGQPSKFPLRFSKNGKNSTTTASSTRIPSTTSNSRSSLVRPGSFKSTVNKDTQEKLICLRKERADLLKKGCKPTDNLIIEINTLIERLARQ